MFILRFIIVVVLRNTSRKSHTVKLMIIKNRTLLVSTNVFTAQFKPSHNSSLLVVILYDYDPFIKVFTSAIKNRFLDYFCELHEKTSSLIGEDEIFLRLTPLG